MAVPLKNQGMRQRVAAEGAESGASHGHPCRFCPQLVPQGLCGGALPLLLGRGVEHAGRRALGLGVSEELGDPGVGDRSTLVSGSANTVNLKF